MHYFNVTLCLTYSALVPQRLYFFFLDGHKTDVKMKKTKSLGVNYQDSVSRKRKIHKIPQTVASKGHLTKLMQTRRFMREENKETIYII